MYRYRDKGGSTRRSLEAMKHLPKIGKLKVIRAYCHRGKHANCLAIMVKGDQGSARFSSFCWGYSGEGPRGLMQLFEALGIPKHLAKHIVYKIPSPDWQKVRDFWQIEVRDNCVYDFLLYNDSGEVETHWTLGFLKF